MQLSWPDAETAYVFVSRILDDVCKAAIFYGDRMCQKVEQCHDENTMKSQSSSSSSHEHHNNETLHFTLQQCHALNNVEFVLQSIYSFPQDLGKDNLISKIEDLNGGLVADACKKTIDVLVRNAVDDVENHILKVRMHQVRIHQLANI